MRIFCLGTLVLTGLVACTSNVPDTVRIGVAQPLSGPVAALGTDMLSGARLAASEINSAGIKVDGKPVHIEIVSVDDQSQAAIGEQVAHRLVDAGVVAVIGHLNSGVSIRAAPVYARSGIPQLSISTQPRYTELGFPTTLRLVASDSIQARAMGSFAATLLGSGTYAVVDDGTSYGSTLADLAEQSLKEKGRNVALRYSADDKTTDFASLIEKLRTAHANLIVTSLSDFQVVALLDQMSAAGMEEIKIVGGDSIKTDKLLGRKLSLDVYATSPVLDPTQFVRGKQFVTAFSKEYGTQPVYAAHYSYDAMYLLAAAMQRAGSVDGRTLTRTLRELGFVAPINHTMKFGASGDQVYGSVGIYRPRGGRWEPLMSSDKW